MANSYIFKSAGSSICLEERSFEGVGRAEYVNIFNIDIDRAVLLRDSLDKSIDEAKAANVKSMKQRIAELKKEVEDKKSTIAYLEKHYGKEIEEA